MNHNAKMLLPAAVLLALLVLPAARAEPAPPPVPPLPPLAEPPPGYHPPDPEDLQVLGAGYSMSENGDAIYSYGRGDDPLPLPGVDAQTFSYLDWGYAGDRNHVYYRFLRLDGLSPINIRIEEEYAVSPGAAYWLWHRVEGADTGTFRPGPVGFATDRLSAYFEGERIAGGDGPSFKVVGGGYFSCYYAADRARAWYACPSGDTEDGTFYAHAISILEADPATLEMVDQGGQGPFARDKDRVYYQGEALEGSDGPSFLFVYDPYTKDKNNVYYDGKKIEGADAASFQVAEHYCEDQPVCVGYGIDKNYAYKQDQRYKPLGELLKEVPSAQAEVAEKLARVFQDVPSDSPLHTAAVKAKEAGWLTGYPDGTLGTNRAVNRAEFAKMAIQALGLSETGTEGDLPFPDVPADAWYAPTLYTALKLGAVTGYPDGTAKPGQGVNRAEALKIILELLGKNYGEAGAQYTDTPPDAWYGKYAAFSKAHGLIPDDGGKLHPEQALYRGEAVELISRVLDLR